MVIEQNRGLEALRKFRVGAVRRALVLTAVVAVVAYFVSPVSAQGVLLGGIGGLLGFWILAIRIEKLAIINPEKVKFSVLTWSILRFALYGIVLTRGYTLDRETYHGLWGALVGVLIIRVVLMYLGITGKDLSLGGSSNEEE